MSIDVFTRKGPLDDIGWNPAVGELCGIRDEKEVALRPLVFTLNLTRRLP
jgi:hypothetical protein